MNKGHWFIILVVIGVLLIGYYKNIFKSAINKVKVKVEEKVVGKVGRKETVDSVIERIKDDVWSRLQEPLKKAGFEKYAEELLLLGLKEEQMLQVYGYGSNGIKLIKEYPFTATSGVLGPKLKEGDKQIPEGIYGIGYMNPNSAYYLSIKVDYPNAFDRSKTSFDHVADMGGDIFIHGKATTVGCIPIGDIAIEELFVMIDHASRGGVKVIISPRDFRKGKTYPVVEGIDWEVELYDRISDALVALPL